MCSALPPRERQTIVTFLNVENSPLFYSTFIKDNEIGSKKNATVCFFSTIQWTVRSLATEELYNAVLPTHELNPFCDPIRISKHSNHLSFKSEEI